MIEYYKWLGHNNDRGIGFYTIQPSRRPLIGEEEYQYLGWFFMNGTCHFGDRMNHSAAPNYLEDITFPITDKHWRGMIQDIFEEEWSIEL